MRLLISILTLMLVTSFQSKGLPEPSPTIAATELESKAKSEVVEMEKQLTLAMEKKDTAVLEKVLAASYFDTFEGTRKALSKSGSIARCKAGVLDFLPIEKQQQLSGKVDLITVEGLARHKPNRIDDTMPEEQWVHVRRLWEKKDGQWLLTSQIRRLIQDDKKAKNK